jgi:ABC-type uncharacterized transport system permease subunit
MMHSAITVLIVVLFVLSLIAVIASWRQLLRRASSGASATRVILSIAILALGIATAILAAFAGDQTWRPLDSHLDGLLVIAVIHTAIVMFLDHPRRLPGLSAFALPVLPLLFAWALCAHQWTWYLFQMDSVWHIAHVLAAYPGVLCAVVAGGAGLMYLYAQRRMRHLDEYAATKPLASLEATERLVARALVATFSLLTLAIIVGALHITQGDVTPGASWRARPKVIVSMITWLIYAGTITAHRFGRLRGAPFAWMTLVAMLLMLVSVSLSTLVPEAAR